MSARMMMDYHGHTDPLPEGEAAGDLLLEQAQVIMSSGTCGQRIWFGAVGAQPDLRVDIDIDTDRAAVCWLSDGTIAVELPPGPELSIAADADGNTATVPGSHARVSVARARDIVTDYATTGSRPGGVTWQAPS